MRENKWTNPKARNYWQWLSAGREVNRKVSPRTTAEATGRGRENKKSLCEEVTLRGMRGSGPCCKPPWSLSSSALASTGTRNRRLGVGLRGRKEDRMTKAKQDGKWENLSPLLHASLLQKNPFLKYKSNNVTLQTYNLHRFYIAHWHRRPFFFFLKLCTNLPLLNSVYSLCTPPSQLLCWWGAGTSLPMFGGQGTPCRTKSMNLETDKSVFKFWLLRFYLEEVG